jgi:hypothetical protein
LSSAHAYANDKRIIPLPYGELVKAFCPAGLCVCYALLLVFALCLVVLAFVDF